MIAFGMATTSALTLRVHCCCTGAAAAVVVAGAVSVFTESVSALGDTVAGLVVSFGTGAIASDAGFTTGALNSATGLLADESGVCAPTVAAASKQKVNTVNEATMRTEEFEPNIRISFIRFSGRNIKRQKDQNVLSGISEGGSFTLRLA
jgi:hypothetical protein